ncbi:MAG: SWIM zinc finger domain-containing protein [Bacteroidia bacterium]|nr:SWIM zinc finger domain-containing protein [Bacteroidia bacterium]
MNWTLQQILSLSAIPATQSNAQKIAKGTTLSNLGTDESFLWGECQGSGSSAYFITIDLSDGAAKCNCPARQFPCKHALGLFLYFAASPHVFHKVTPPSWATAWMEKRKKGTPVISVVTPEIQEQKTVRKEELEDKKMETLKKDLDDAILWVEDIIRSGIASQESRMYEFAEAQKVWMSNAKAEGLRALIDEIARTVGDGEGTEWLQKFLLKSGELYFLFKLLKNIEAAQEPFRKSVKQLIGFYEQRKDVLPLPAIKDIWMIMGSIQEEVEDKHNLLIRKIWLYGKKTGERALITDFAFNGVFTEQYGPTGSCFEGEIVYYPGIVRQRALVKTQIRTIEKVSPVFMGFEENFRRHAQEISAFPWLKQFPFLLSEMKIGNSGKQWFLTDSQMKAIPMKISREKAMYILVLTGNQSFNVFGEWLDNQFLPLTIFTHESIFPVNQKKIPV